MSRICLFQQAASPGTPAAGQVNLWAATDDKLKWTEDDGDVHVLAHSGEAESFLSLTVQGQSSLGTTGTNNPVLIGKEAASAYGAISLNNSLAVAAMTGMIGTTGDTNLYYQVPTGGVHTFRVNGANTRFAVNNAGASVTGTLGVTGKTQIGQSSSWVSASSNLEVSGAIGIGSRVASGAATNGALYLWHDATTGDNSWIVLQEGVAGTTKGKLDYDRTNDRVRITGTNNGVMVDGPLVLNNTGGSIHRGLLTGGLTITGGINALSDGASFQLFGSSHATQANNSFYNATKHTFRTMAGGNGAANPLVAVAGNLQFTGTTGGNATEFWDGLSGAGATRHFNTPTGGSFAWSVNNADRMSLNNTAVSIGTGSASSTPFLKCATWDTMMWSGSTLHFGGLTASQWDSLTFYVGGTERSRIISTGHTKNSNSGSYYSVGAPFHETISNTASQPSHVVANSSGTNPSVATYVISSTAPNNTTSHFLYNADFSALRAVIFSNGGLHNFSANNVNLSDERTKAVIEPMPNFWDEWKNINWKRYMFTDQTHQDWNYGYSAQNIANVFGAKAAGIVGNFGANGSGKLGVHEADLHNIAGAVLTQAVKRIDKIVAALAAANITVAP